MPVLVDFCTLRCDPCNVVALIIEADSLSRLFELARKMHESVLNTRIKRVITIIKMDDRIDKKLTMTGKIKSLQKKLE